MSTNRLTDTAVKSSASATPPAIMLPTMIIALVIAASVVSSGRAALNP
jgi:hypothetical protein